MYVDKLMNKSPVLGEQFEESKCRAPLERVGSSSLFFSSFAIRKFLLRDLLIDLSADKFRNDKHVRKHKKYPLLKSLYALNFSSNTDKFFINL